MDEGSVGARVRRWVRLGLVFGGGDDCALSAGVVRIWICRLWKAVGRKYASPAKAATLLQTGWLVAWSLTVGVCLPAWNGEIESVGFGGMGGGR